MKLIDKNVFFSSPGKGVLVYGNSFYTGREGREKVSIRSEETRNDMIDVYERRFSSDNGKTWSEPENLEFLWKRPNGMLRQFIWPGFIDPVNGRMITMILEGLLPSDEAEEGMKNWYLRYRVSHDGGRTGRVDERVIQKGDYSPDHPCEGVWVGKNSIMIGDLVCRPIRTSMGKILVPVVIGPLDSNGEHYNPGGGGTYHDAAVLIGSWREDGRLEWDLSSCVKHDPAKSTRGCDEPTLAELPDGRILMVIRGSNGGMKDPEYKIPGYRWYSISTDGGYTWSPVRPWTYDDGTVFFSPSSCSQLLHHSNGNDYWLGNITPENPKGNSPRYPFVLGRVDPQSGLLIKDSVTMIDTRQADDHLEMMLSCFMAHEDRESRQILLHMSRMFVHGVADWRGDAYLYRIEP